MSASHQWLHGGTLAGRRAVAMSLGLPAELVTGPVDAHRRHGGPYTMARSLVEDLVPRTLTFDPDLVRRHDIELLTISSALSRVVPATRETLTSLAVPYERTRFYSPARTLRHAHGLTEFIRDHVAALRTPLTLHVENIEHADPTDRELLEVLLRRIDPELLTLVVGSGGQVALPGSLTSALLRSTTGVAVPCADADARRGPMVSPGRPKDRAAITAPVSLAAGSGLAAAYVAGDCVSDEPAPQRAYADLPPAQRRHLHDLRARELGRGENPVGLLGALPFHRERGSDPAAAVAALLAALDHCVDRGFYDATIDLAERGRALTTWSPEQATDRFDFTTKLTTSLAALGRAREAEPLYDEIRAVTTHPLRQIQAAYATAMLYTRHHDPDSRDDLIATGWANIAIALAESNPDPKQRAFQTAFNRNGLALIEVHKGHLDMALQIVEGCLSLLDREIDPGEHRLHRSVLLYNRGQVKAGLGDLEGAIDDYDAVIAQDPHYAEYYLDRGSLRRRLGDDPGALADYGMAITLSPPFPEVFYNRADTRAALGDLEGAVEDFAYVHELDPGNVDALLNRAGLLTELGRWTEAQRDVEAGLTLSPDSALLHCIRGQVAAATARPSQARAAFGAALRLDPGMPEALVGRAGLSFDEGSVGEAIRDLDRAVAVADGAIVRFNRATALAAVGRLNEALSDFDEAARLDPEDEDTVSARTALLLRRELEKPLAAS